MIPEQFKQNINLEILVFGFPVHVNDKFYWPEKRDVHPKDPLVSHIEFRSDSRIISDTGYRSHFFYTHGLIDTQLKDIEELVTAIAEKLSIENGYKPPIQGQMTLF